LYNVDQDANLPQQMLKIIDDQQHLFLAQTADELKPEVFGAIERNLECNGNGGSQETWRADRRQRHKTDTLDEALGLLGGSVDSESCFADSPWPNQRKQAAPGVRQQCHDGVERLGAPTS
jgi:hypothetical protein